MGMRVVLMVPSPRTSAQILERGLLNGSGEWGFFPLFFPVLFFSFSLVFSSLLFFLVCWAVIVDTEGGMIGWMGRDGMEWDGMGRNGNGVNGME